MTAVAAATTAVLIGAAFAATWPLLGRLDNHLGGDMPVDSRRRPLRARIRDWLGLDHLDTHLRRIEEHMATVTEALTALAKQVNDVSAAQAASFHNLQTAIDKLKSGDLTPEQQDAVNQIEQSLTQLADDAQKADDGYEPDTSDEPADTSER